MTDTAPVSTPAPATLPAAPEVQAPASEPVPVPLTPYQQGHADAKAAILALIAPLDARVQVRELLLGDVRQLGRDIEALTPEG